MVLSGISACRFSFQAKTMRKRLHVVFSMGTINTVNGWKYSANGRNCSSWNPFQGKHCMKNKPRAGSGKNAHWAAFLPEIVRAKTRAFTKISYTYTCNLQPAIGSAWLEKIDWKDLGLNFQSEGVLRLIALFSLNRNTFSSGFWRPTHAWNLCLLGG